jgi:hypothetical protein
VRHHVLAQLTVFVNGLELSGQAIDADARFHGLVGLTVWRLVTVRTDS